MSATPTTSATGGSASSQADSLDGRAWNPHPIVSFLIKALLLIVPLLVGVLAVKIAMEVVTRPHGWLRFWTWMIGLVTVSFVASIGTQRILRRFAPLAMLFKMSLVFPDEAPSRFKAAMRSGSTRSLARGARPSSAPAGPQQAAAEELLALISRLSRHDRLTRGHVERVRAYSLMLGEEIGLSRSDLDKLNWAALIHDIGKLEVPESLLNKAGRPTADEWTVLRTHPGAGGPYVEPLRSWLGEWVDATTQHHERFDGKGYPRGLAGKDISLAGRIVSIADAYDVMTAARSYKKPLPAAQARAELTRNSGTQFDPHLVRSFLEISLGRLRRSIGPVGWLAHLPDLLRTPLTAVAGSTTGIVAAGAVGLATVAGAAAPAVEMATPRHQSAPLVEEVLHDTTPSTTVVHIVPQREPAPTTPETATDTAPTVVDQPATLVGATVATTTTTTTPDEVGTVPVVIVEGTTVGPVAVPAPAPAATAPTMATTATTATLPAPAPAPPPTPAPPPAPAPPPPPTTTAAATTTAPAAATVAVDDQASGKDDKFISVHVVQNDTFGGSVVDILSLTLVSGPSHGSAVVSGENIVYRSDHGFRGTDTFVYSVCSLAGSCDQATVTMAITH